MLLRNNCFEEALIWNFANFSSMRFFSFNTPTPNVPNSNLFYFVSWFQSPYPWLVKREVLVRPLPIKTLPPPTCPRYIWTISPSPPLPPPPLISILLPPLRPRLPLRFDQPGEEAVRDSCTRASLLLPVCLMMGARRLCLRSARRASAAMCSLWEVSFISTYS